MRMAERIARRRQAREAAYAEQEALAAAQAAVVKAAMVRHRLPREATEGFRNLHALAWAEAEADLDAACADLKKLGG